MTFRPIFLALGLAALMPVAPAALAETTGTQNGTDSFISGSSSLPPVAADGDVFVSGGQVVLKGRAGGDAHVAGFGVDVEAPVAGDLYATGANVTVRAAVGSDLSAAGFTVRLAEPASVAGNARLIGATVTVDGPVTGALTAGGAEVTLNSVVTGDVLVSAQTLNFGPDARIAGTLRYSAPAAVTIPASVIPADRVTFTQIAATEMMQDMRDSWRDGRMPSVPSRGVMIWSGIVGYSFLLLIGAIALAAAPVRSEALRVSVLASPGRSLLLGVAGLAMLFGLIPVAAITIVGLPFIPVIAVMIAVLWVLGYLLGLYAITRRLAGSLVDSEPGLLLRVVLLALGILCAALLNFIPLLGWIANIALMLLGIGALTRATLRRLTDTPAAIIAP